MSATPQPIQEPFRPGVSTAPAATTHRPPRRWPLVIGAAVVIALVAFGGGYAVANATSTRSPGRTFSGANGQSSSGASGSVASVASDQMTVTTQSGSSRIVLLTPTTTVTKVTSSTVTASDITTGTQVTVIGSSNPDGSVTATQVVIGDAGLFGRGTRTSSAASPAASSAP